MLIVPLRRDWKNADSHWSNLNRTDNFRCKERTLLDAEAGKLRKPRVPEELVSDFPAVKFRRKDYLPTFMDNEF